MAAVLKIVAAVVMVLVAATTMYLGQAYALPIIGLRALTFQQNVALTVILLTGQVITKVLAATIEAADD